MRQFLARALVVTAVTAGSLVISRPATAAVWKNYFWESQCIGVAGGDMNSGTELVIWDCDGHSDQNWSGQTQSNWGSYIQMWSGGSAAPPSTAAECIGLANDGSINDGNKAIIWSCSALTTDQGWEQELVIWDRNGHPCFDFVNKKAFDATGTKKALAVLRPPFGDIHGQPLGLDNFHGVDPDQTFCLY